MTCDCGALVAGTYTQTDRQVILILISIYQSTKVVYQVSPIEHLFPSQGSGSYSQIDGCE